MAFAFTAEQRERLFDALGRRDSGAWHLTEDVELALEGYGGAELRGSDTDSMAFGQMLAKVFGLRQDLYALPERARRLTALDTLGRDDAADLLRLAHVSGEALDRLGAKLAEVAAVTAAVPGPDASAERLVHAIGQAYRNRLNIKATSDARGLFRRFLDALMDLIQRRHADLDELWRGMTEERLARIIGADETGTTLGAGSH